MSNFFKMVFLALFACSSGLAFSATNSTFEAYCKICHDKSMAAMFGAPAAHDMLAWDLRKADAFGRAVSKNGSIKNSIGNDKYEHIINELLLTAKEGTPKGMPPRGTCIDCSDDELRAAIRFISSE